MLQNGMGKMERNTITLMSRHFLMGKVSRKWVTVPRIGYHNGQPRITGHLHLGESCGDCLWWPHRTDNSEAVTSERLHPWWPLTKPAQLVAFSPWSKEQEVRFCVFPCYFAPSFSSLWNGFSDSAVFQSGRARDSCKLRHREECPVLLLAGTLDHFIQVWEGLLYIFQLLYLFTGRNYISHSLQMFLKSF